MFLSVCLSWPDEGCIPSVHYGQCRWKGESRFVKIAKETFKAANPT